MVIREDPNRFSLPVETFIRQLLAEKHPKLNTAPGSAIYDLVITPISLVQQAARDRSRVIQRNQSIKNFATMLPEEFDRLAANFFVERRAGTQASGIQRIYFSALQNVFIDTNVEFSDGSDLTFHPIQAVSLSSASLAANRITATGEYYTDIEIISDVVGDAVNVKAGAITSVVGLSGVSRTVNITDLFGGADPESNGDLYVRIKKSIASRDTVKSDSFKSLILNTFPTVTDVIVQGYGDTYMTRDTARVVLSTEKMFQASFAQKVNLPLDSTGNVAWTDDAGNAVVAPLGGYVGALVDLTGKDFNALSVSADGKTYEIVSAQPGFKIKFLNKDDADYQDDYYVVTRVEQVPIEPGGELTKVLRLDRPLNSVNAPETAVDGAEYTLVGYIGTNTFHVGGKVDIYLKSSAEMEKFVVVAALPKVNASSDFVSEIPLTTSFVDANGNGLFEGNVGFTSPVISITKVEQLDPTNDDVVVRTLIPGVHYNVIKASTRGKYTLTENDVLRIEGSEEVLTANGDPSGVEIGLFVGERIRVTYITNQDVNVIQEYLDRSDVRDITKDVDVLYPTIVLIDTTISYSGPVDVDTVKLVLTRYISSLGFGAEITVNDLINVLAFFNVTDIQMPVVLTSKEDNGDGTMTVNTSEDRLALDPIKVFRAVPDLSITKLG